MVRTKTDRYETLGTIEEALENLSSEITVEKPYWFAGDLADKYYGSYCYKCSQSILKAEKKKDKKTDLEIDGGFDCEEEDAAYCEKCGVLLEYTLSDYGVEQELEYFQYERDNTRLLTNQEAYELLRIFNGQTVEMQLDKLDFWLTMQSLIPTTTTTINTNK